jgi:hypothetical protein
MAEVKAFLGNQPFLEEVRFVCFGDEAYEVYQATLATF